MTSFRNLQRIFFIIIIIGAATGQRRQTQQQTRDHYEIAPVHPATADYTAYYLPIPIAHYSPPTPNEQYAFQKPTHQFQHFQQTGNGNTLAATEIAMEILRDTFPPNIENRNDATEYYERPSTTQKDSFDFLEKEHNNFRRSNTAASPRRQGQENLIPNNVVWHQNALGYDDNDATPIVNDDWPPTRMNYVTSLALDINNETAPANDDYELSVKAIKPSSNSADIENSDGNSRSPILIHLDNELTADKDDFWEKNPTKRNPVAIGDHMKTFAQPRYPFAFLKKNANGGSGSGGDDKRNTKFRSNKRERARPQRTTFITSISPGAMPHLGHFFNDLSKNVRFNERNEFRDAEAKLLHGEHPLSMLQTDVADDSDEQSKIEKTAEFLHAIRSYRPSQKIRSLVSMNPQGYHGSNFLDPNYMWVGLG